MSDHDPVSLEDFPRWRLFWRIEQEMGTSLTGRWSVALVIGLLSALVVAVVDRSSVQPKAGSRPSWDAVILRALVAGVVVYIVVAVVIFGWHLARYRLLGDPVWTPTGVEGNRRVAFELVCETDPPVELSSLGHVDAAVTCPTGEVMHVPDWQLKPRGNPSGWSFLFNRRATTSRSV